MRRIISEEQEKEICLLIQTTSQKNIAKKYCISQPAVSVILKRNNIKHPGKYRLNSGKLKVDVDYFKEIDDKYKAYWLGYLTADGNINKGNNKCTLISKDYEVIDKFKKSISSDHKININRNLDNRTNSINVSYSIQITNQNFVNNLINIGVTNKKTDNMILPSMSDSLIPYFYAGLFDGDGSIGYRKAGNKLRVSLIATKELLLYLQNILLNKFSVSETKLQKVTKNKQNVWKMFLYKDSLVFLQWIYSDNDFIYLTRKYNIYAHPIP